MSLTDKAEALRLHMLEHDLRWIAVKEVRRFFRHTVGIDRTISAAERAGIRKHLGLISVAVARCSYWVAPENMPSFRARCECSLTG